MPRKKSTVKYALPEEAYLPGGLTILKAAGIKEARKEYSRLRRLAMRRLREFRGTEYESGQIYQHRMGKGKFKTLWQIATAAQLGAALGDVRGFLESSQSTVARLRERDRQILETLHEHEYNFVTKENLQDFGRFMEAVRMSAQARMYPSDQVAELYEASIKRKIDPDELLKDFSYWMENKEELEKSRTRRGVTQVSANEYRKRIEQRKKRKK